MNAFPPTHLAHICTGKHGYPNKATALTVIRNLQKHATKPRRAKERKRQLANISAYQCPACHLWHIGRTPKPWSNAK